MNQQCKVCGEPAAGFHFGAFTCEGCKVRILLLWWRFARCGCCNVSAGNDDSLELAILNFAMMQMLNRCTYRKIKERDEIWRDDVNLPLASQVLLFCLPWNAFPDFWVQQLSSAPTRSSLSFFPCECLLMQSVVRLTTTKINSRLAS